MGMQRADVQGRFSTMLDNFSTMRCDVTESATSWWVRRGDFYEVSIHALVRVRHLEKACQAEKQGFNPRTRESATANREQTCIEIAVSIHALVRVRPL